MHEDFEVIGKIESVETIAVGQTFVSFIGCERRSGMGVGAN